MAASFPIYGGVPLEKLIEYGKVGPLYRQFCTKAQVDYLANFTNLLGPRVVLVFEMDGEIKAETTYGQAQSLLSQLQYFHGSKLAKYGLTIDNFIEKPANRYSTYGDMLNITKLSIRLGLVKKHRVYVPRKPGIKFADLEVMYNDSTKIDMEFDIEDRWDYIEY